MPCFPGKLLPAAEGDKRGFAPADLSLWYSVEVPDSMKNDFFLNAIRSLPWIDHVEWKREEARPLSLPDDPGADSLAGSQRQVLNKIRAYQGWTQSKGDSSVLIGILDTGTPITHEDISGNLFRNWADPVNGLDDDGNGLVDDFTGWDFGGNDNNPTPDNTGTAPGHGTSVSSLAGASTDNATGIAGIGWKCRILPLKIWAWNGSFSNFSGYEAIVYAADMGCRVINCSWGSPGSGSQYEQDIIRYASINKGALVVAAGGNTAGYFQYLPANYDYAFGVSMTDTNDRIVSAASRHFKLDLMAPGVGVFGIKTNGTYGWVDGGTSMASPMVAGAAGLVLSKYPQLSGLQAGELLRVNSDTIYSLSGNAGYRDQTGRGRLNIERALNRENRISLRAVECIPIGLGRPGDTLRLALRFENYLDSVAGFSVKLYSGSGDLAMLANSSEFGAIGSLKDFTSNPVFTARVNPARSGRKSVSIRADVTSGTYTDRKWFTFQLNPEWVNLDSNEVELTLAENGRLGFSDLSGYFGRGIRYKGIQMSSDAGLMIGSSANKVADCIFAGPSNNLNFKAENRFQFLPWPGLSQHAVFHFNDSLAGNQSSGIGIKQSAFESTVDSLSACAFVTYQVSNRGTVQLDSLCLGMYNDWGSGNPEQNFGQWVDELQMLLTRPAGKGKMAATMVLGNGEPQVFAIDAIPDTSGNNINLYDGFSKAEKWKSLSSGKARLSAGGSTGKNVVQVCGLKWRNLQAGETRKLGFAFLFADSLPEMEKKARSARSFFRHLNQSPSPSELETTFCAGDTIRTNQTGDGKVAVFADAEGMIPVFEGMGFSPEIFSDTSWYVSGRDSLFPGPLTRIQFQQQPLPEVALNCGNCPPGDTVLLGSSLNFTVSGNPGIRHWFRNDSLLPGPANTCCQSIIPLESGSLTVCVEISDSLSGCRNRVCREFTVIQVTSEPVQLTEKRLRVFPNPAREELMLELPEKATFTLHDLTGRRLLIHTFDAGLHTIDLGGIPPGMYLWKAIAGEKIWFGKMEKK